jgi:hypothetical protein
MGRQRPIIGGSVRPRDRADVLGQQTGVSNTGESQRTPEGTAPLRQREASRIRMKVRSPARQSAVRIGLKPEKISRFHRDEPHQCGGRRAFATADAGSRRADHRKVYPSRTRFAYAVSYPLLPHHAR